MAIVRRHLNQNLDQPLGYRRPFSLQPQPSRPSIASPILIALQPQTTHPSYRHLSPKKCLISSTRRKASRVSRERSCRLWPRYASLSFILWHDATRSPTQNLGIKANQKSTEIINEVLELQNAEESEDDESQDEPPATNKEDSKETHCRTTSHSLHPVNPLPLRGGRYGHSLPQGGVLSSQQHLVEMASNSRNRSSACGGTPEHLSSPHLAHQSPRYENTSPKLEDSPQYTRRTQNQARSPQSPAFSPSSPLAQPASLPRNQQEREYSPVIEAAPTRFRPQDATAGTTFTSNIAARREAARPAQLVAESPRTTDPAAPATPSSSPKETKPVHHTPKAGPSNSNQEITPPSYSPRVYPSGWGKKQGNEGSGNAMSLSPPAKPQTPKELSERRNRFERQSSVHHFPGVCLVCCSSRSRR